MNIIAREFKANLKSFIIWIISLSLLFYVASFEFEMFQNDPRILEAFETFDYIFNALGGIPDLTTAAGYLSLVSLYLYIPLAIYSALLGSRIISKEEQNKTAEYLFTLPVSRNKVIVSKFTVALTYTIVINIISMLVCLYSFGRFSNTLDTFSIYIVNLGIAILLTQIIFLSIGMFLSSVLKQYKRSGGITIGILIGTFMISMLVGLAEKADALKYITPFQYFSASEMLTGNFEFIYILITTVIIVLSFTGLFIFYKKRDLYI